MDIKIEHIFDADIELFEKIWNDQKIIQEEIFPKLPNMKSREVKEERKDKGILHRTVKYTGDSKLLDLIPGARKVVKEHMLCWHEETKYYPDKHYYEFKVIPDFFKDRAKFEGECNLVSQGNKTKRTIKGKLEIKAPFVTRKIIEKVISKLLSDVTNAEFKALSEVISKTEKV